MEGQRLLCRQLQKSFAVLQSDTPVWKKMLRDTSESVSYLVNLGEQFHCCRRVHIADTPLAPFEDLSHRLQYKLSVAMQQKVDELQQALKCLEEASRKLSHQRASTMETYQQHASQISLVSTVVGEPLWPAIATMIEWLTDIDQDLFLLLREKEFLLETLDFTQTESLDILQRQWTSDGGLVAKVTDILAYLVFFKEQEF